jgi:ATP-binding cassette subfamily G (WHITE) protein 2 (PDR)
VPLFLLLLVRVALTVVAFIVPQEFFVNMGFYCAPQQTTPDFLTGLTSSLERRPREGFEKRVPHTPEEFEAAWKASPEYKLLKQELAAYGQKYPTDGAQLEEWNASRRAQQSKHLCVSFCSSLV